ncbi:BrnA antitoxin family protein [Glaciimonas sp. GG7]
MVKKIVNPEYISEDNPEWTVEDFANSRPAKDVLPELFGEKIAAEMLKPKRGRPLSANKKESIAIRLDADVLAALKASGDGWQTRINDALRALFIGR